MRLWHQDLIPWLDDKHLLALHRSCCSLRGRGWKKDNSADYVFKYDLAHLYQYHLIVIHEMYQRDIRADPDWYRRQYRGKSLPASTLLETGSYVCLPDQKIYKEHDDKYLHECLVSLLKKKASLKGKSIHEWLMKLELKD